jgi:hypothetical protein
MHRTLLGAAALIVIGVFIGVAPDKAEALPSYARQTGLPCGVCHTVFPQLTPFGRRFKLSGYTMGGGQFRTTPFRSSNTAEGDASKRWVPPLSLWAQFGMTHTQMDQDNTGTPFRLNDNWLLQTLTLAYGGAITDHIGAFAQIAYVAPGLDTHQIMWDTVDIRYAKATTGFGVPVIFGLTVHNMPTLQDVWNTVSVWSYPFLTSALMPTPAASTILEGAFNARVIGVGAYAFINDVLYIEATGYKTLSPNAQDALGIDSTGLTIGEMDRVAPYFRIAYEPHWGNHWLEVGAFALFAELNPLQPWIPNLGIPGTDKYTDAGVDLQYQYMGPNYSLTIRGSFISEDQRLDASFANGISANPTNQLRTFKASASFVHGKNKRWEFTAAYFSTTGTSDALLYAASLTNSPNSSGWIAEIAYMPFGNNPAPFWPWFNARIGLQYIRYNEFNGASVNYDGMGHNSSDNNTLFMYTWVAW